MGYVSRRDSARLVARLRRNGAALIMAGGRLPDGPCWIESLVPAHAVRAPGEWRWQVVSENGWANIGSPWAVHLVMNADHIYFHPKPEGCVTVEMTP